VCADIGCGCGMPVPTDYSELDFAPYGTAGEATVGHVEMCEKWAAMSTAKLAGEQVENNSPSPLDTQSGRD
jgi:hypothetical protein